MEYDSFIVKWMWGGNFPFFTLPVSHSFICLAGPRAFVPWIQEVNDSTIFYLQPNLVPYYYCCHCSSSSPSGVRMLLSLLRIPWDFIAWRECSRLKFYLWGVNFKQQYLHPEGSSDPTVVAFHLFDILRTRRCTTVRDSEGQAIPCNGGSDGSGWVMGKWSMQWVSGWWMPWGFRKYRVFFLTGTPLKS